jgi:ATP-dependent RNA helicase RhlE
LKDFINLGLASPLLDALAKQGYKKPTPIQIKAIPPALEGKDILGTAQTGTGKTAAFTLPILQQILPVLKDKNKRPIRVLILTPTRELAIQIHENISHYGSQTKVFHSVIFGGVGQKPQTDALRRGVDIITATPGRLLDLMNQGYVNLSRIEHFVLDEADRMLDMGFIHDVKKIFSKIPSKRQTLLFSATMPKEVLSLSNFLLKDPIRISVAPVSATAEKVNQKVFFVDQKSKRLLLKSLLKNDKIDISSVLVFTRTKHGANRVVKDLTKNNITAQAIHGNKSQNARQNALDNFKKRITRVLVATDIAARGIDIDDLSHVINYDIPNIPETYVHRIGRTGRAGNSGIAWSFVDTEEHKYLSDIQKLIKKEIEIEINHEFLPQSNAGTEKRVQKSKRNSSNEKKFKKNKLKKMQRSKKVS